MPRQQRVKRTDSRAPKFKTKAEKEQAWAMMVDLLGKGFSQYEVARRVGVSQPAVSYAQAKITERAIKAGLLTETNKIAEMILKLCGLREACWDAYKLSMEPEQSEKTTRQLAPIPRDSSGNPIIRPRGEPLLRITEQIKESKGRLPSTDYLRLIFQTYQLESEITGIKRNVIINNDNRSVNVTKDNPGFWTELTGEREALHDPGRDIIEARGLPLPPTSTTDGGPTTPSKE